MSSVAIVLFEALACLGFGAALLRVLGISGSLSWTERTAWSFLSGLGLVGWLIFFVGTAAILTTGPLALVLGLGCLGVFFLGLPEPDSTVPLSAVERILMAALLVTLSLDVFEGIAPPGDADSLAYHFNLPRVFLSDQQISFVPRAIDGAIPLLVQMTYVPALGLGGEKALTLWTMLTSWGVAFALYCFCRHHLDRSWSLVVTLLWLTTPAVLAGGGSGQVEVRLAGFVLLVTGALMQARSSGLYRWVAFAGLVTGMYVGTKYTGLMFGAACGLALFGMRQWPKQMLVFGLTSLLIGFQWYFWNWLHTGDPVFPMLFKLLGPDHYAYWDMGHQRDLENLFFRAENAIPNNLLSMILYPFLATFSVYAKFDSERIGLGPYMLLVLPMVIAGLWTCRTRLARSRLWVPALIIGVYYCLWFLTGSSQRIRHLVPLYPVLLALVTVVVAKWAADKGRRRLIFCAFFLTLSLQLAGQAASGVNYLRYGLTDETRDAFLARNISGYDAVLWINDYLAPQDRVLVANRQLLYLINSRTYFGQTITQNLIDLSARAVDAQVFFRQLKAQGITHVLATPSRSPELLPDEKAQGLSMWKLLVKHACAEVIHDSPYRHVASRSLSRPRQTDLRHYLLRLSSGPCVLPG